MWCVAPDWPEHARHVAVEFVHPVIMGKRALPSVVDRRGPSAITTLRTTARSGDILVAVAPSDDGVVRDAMQRAPAWGVLGVWIGCGPKPASGLADHLVWAEDASPLARHDGSMVLAYHVLWELVHVCFEHPGLLRSPDLACERRRAPASPARTRAAWARSPRPSARALASVRTAAGVEEVDTTLVDPAPPGTLVLIHAGVAIARVESASVSSG